MGRIIVDGQQVSDAINAAQGIAVSKDAGAATPKRPLIDVTDTGPVVVNVTDDGGGNKVIIEVDSSAVLDAAAHAAIDHSSIIGSGGGTLPGLSEPRLCEQPRIRDGSVLRCSADRLHCLSERRRWLPSSTRWRPARGSLRGCVQHRQRLLHKHESSIAEVTT